MKTKEELHKEFLEEFRQLLLKYNASLSTDSITKGYYSYDQAVIDFEGIYEGDNQRSYSQLDLPSYLD